MKPVILFRKDFSRFSDYSEELFICRQYFDTYTQRSLIPPYSRVIGRYSVLPYYLELEEDLNTNKCGLINSVKSHRWVADFEWYADLVKELGPDITPQTWWADNCNIQDTGDIPLIVKGATNSKKHSWDSMMYAKDFRAAVSISCELRKDSLLSSQDIIFRKYIPLETFEYGIADLPFTNEWRFFCLRDKILCSGYYWATAECAEQFEGQEAPIEAQQLAAKIAAVVRKFANFYVLDLARTVEGRWILIEINDGQMSGLNTIPAAGLYRRLSAET